MASGRAILTVIVAGVIAACGASTGPSGPLAGTPTEAANTVIASPTRMPIASLAATDSEHNLSPSPSSQRAPTPAHAPPKPAGVVFDQEVHYSDDEKDAHHTQIVRWASPRSEGVEISVYGVTECIARPKDPAPGTSGPCLVTGTPLPASVRTLLGTAPASDGVVSWSWAEGSGCDIDLAHDPDRPPYYAIVLAAYNASRHSIFAIAAPGLWWRPGPNDTVC